MAKPQASKYSKPVELVQPTDPKGWIAFGQELVAAVAMVGQSDEWILRNEEALKRMKDDAPKVYARVMANISPQREAAE